MTVKPKLKPTLKTGASILYVPIKSSDEARICLECPLPAEKCNRNNCSRYREEHAKLTKRAR